MKGEKDLDPDAESGKQSCLARRASRENAPRTPDILKVEEFNHTNNATLSRYEEEFRSGRWHISFLGRNRIKSNTRASLASGESR